MKEKLFSGFTIAKMNKNSLTLEDKRTHEKVFITRDLFNNLDNVEEIRIVDALDNGNKWVEGKYWSRF